METWLPLTDYSSKYKISVSTLRRRIKSDDIKYHFQDGKYFIFDEPVKSSMKSGPSLNSSLDSDLVFDDELLNDLELSSEAVDIDKINGSNGKAYAGFQQPVTLSQTYNPDFLENLKRSANSRLPQVKTQQGALSQQHSLRTGGAINIEEEYFFKKENKMADMPTMMETQTASVPEIQDTAPETPTFRDFSDKISKIGTNEPVLTAANKLLNELKKAYTQILHEKEEQMMILKEEVSDLKTLVKALERENERLKQNW